MKIKFLTNIYNRKYKTYKSTAYNNNAKKKFNIKATKMNRKNFKFN